MPLFIEIPSECYDLILAQIDADSRLYSVLKSGLLFNESGRRVIKLICEQAEVDMMLDASKSICPETVAEIRRSIRLFNPSS
jgi:hypothetical protein